MKLSVIIVNFNVKHFISQCLDSVYDSDTAISGDNIEIEVFVVDNNSTDGSVEWIREHYPQVTLIANVDNPGFAKANNQALELATGDYLLLLNPDTLVEKDTFVKCIEFYKSHADCGGLSVRMVNGTGLFLKESKRGFPSPQASFYKISGLINLFPHHKNISAYYMGHLPDDETVEIDILPGAFLMISRSAYEKIGHLDESYFMYGEDIDYSWRIKLAGFKNYYMPTARILHYKGECTKKGSMNYVKAFYNAMIIFAQHYFSESQGKLFTLLIKIGIVLKATLACIYRIATKMALPLLDFMVSFGGFYAIKYLWATYHASNLNYYPSHYTYTIIPLYILTLMLATFLCGGYDKPVRPGRIVKGMGLGACALLIFYSMLDETMRFSRAIVLFGSLWTIVSTLGIRALINTLPFPNKKQRSKRRRYLVIGSNDEQNRVLQLFGNLGIEARCIQGSDHILKDVPKNIDEIVYCSKDIAIADILDQWEQLQGKGVAFRIAPANDNVLIGSNYIGSPEDIYNEDCNSISTPTNRRLKRIIDVASSFALIIVSPILFWFQQRKGRYFADCIATIIGKKTWVGYSRYAESTPRTIGPNETPLPYLKKGIFRTKDRMPKIKNPDRERLDIAYASDYHPTNDIIIILKNWNRI